VPPSIGETVLELVGGLSQDAQAVLRSVAVVGEPATETTLIAVTECDPRQARAGLSEAITRGLLTESDRGLVSFRHVLASRAVYEHIPRPERRALHRRVGLVLEGQPPTSPAQLARHFREAGEEAEWRRYGERSADLALASGDETAAADALYELLTSAALPVADVARLAGKLPYPALRGQTRRHRLLAALRSALAMPDIEQGVEASIRFQLGCALSTGMKFTAACTELERAIPGLGDDPKAQARAMMLLADPRGTIRPATEHLRWLRRAARLTQPADSADRLRLAVDRVSALLALGAEDGWREAGGLPLTAPDPRVTRAITRSHLNIGDAALHWGRYAEAGWRLGQALETATAHGYRGLRHAALATRARLDWYTGSWTGLATRAGDLADDPDVGLLIRMEAAVVVGLLHAATGKSEQGAERLRAAVEETQRAEALYSAAPAAALARIYLAGNRVVDALQVTEAPMGVIGAKGLWMWATELAPVRVAALAAADREGEASELMVAFAHWRRGRNAPAPRAGLMLCSAELAETAMDHAQAATLYARAASAWQALPRPYDALLARESQASCLLAAGKREAGLSLLCEVLQEASALGATADADRVASRLRGHGVAALRSGRRGRRGYGEQLSPREHEVVQLLLTGQTNAQIAESLSRSPKTVAVQLHSAMRKLGARSRTELAVKAVGEGMTAQDA
jgi:DNA-binding CsgD family transcriptional regulator